MKEKWYVFERLGQPGHVIIVPTTGVADVYRQVGGPFDSKQEADAFASQRALDERDWHRHQEGGPGVLEE